MKFKRKKVFVCGGVSYNAVITLPDFFEPKPQTIHSCVYNETIGNTGAGKALALSNLGFDTTLFSVLGVDEYGAKVKLYLNKPNLNFTYGIDPKGTERHVNILNSKGERISIFTNPNSENLFIDYNKYMGNIESSDFVVINISNYCRNFISICKDLNKEVWTDLHDYDGKNPYHQDFIDASDYIFFSSENINDYRIFMQQMIEVGKKLVVCTHGGNGATAYTDKKEWIYEPAILDFELINSNGAGDCFFSGFLYAYSLIRSIQECMKFGAIAGALCINTKELVSDQLNINVLDALYLKHYNV
ncbi:carbohydrate kinase family protein [Hwangdonia lutea]|uniref:Carbohydrate kinase family protein n=1 Tax=Hwangdonia lutea TaxID=3075823 RepID=A0AA97EMA7_9FLAO|nr:carbohydrate kinase family protein [Hwangdonia sp. SCSIO 19198]WOD43566.1 carbohydrate kinase family protein [Hwangdonia sp. SCSIO 19198]